ncbi:hypothetical protein BDA99DRAFT_604249 [Phascolomyces articulosus]|uniref:F-box domain-containing protein n=1 Tax=Phascolomyces articulosus TaxID=60185 RepID=A0AAD5K1G3_9FUNG|nr:hypothetical protein BDA99DRAFT_604249 [Phascolomyces articulosus]
MATKRLKLVELNKKAMEYENGQNYNQSLRYANSMIQLDNEYSDGYFRKASAYFGLGRYQDVIALCDSGKKEEKATSRRSRATSSSNSSISSRTRNNNITTGMEPKFVFLRKNALERLIAEGGFKIDFVASKTSSLPRELIYEVFSYIGFRTFFTCTHVSRYWRAVLMSSVWPERLPEFREHPLTSLTHEEMVLFEASLRGENDRFMLTINQEERNRLTMVLNMGNCGLYSIDMGGNLQSMAHIIRANRDTLKEVTISSTILTHTVSFLFNALKDCSVSRILFTGPFEVVESPTLTDLVTSLLDIHITSFHTQQYCMRSRVPMYMAFVVTFFLKSCPNLQSLIVHPLEDHRGLSRHALRDIQTLRPANLTTLEFGTTTPS